MVNVIRKAKIKKRMEKKKESEIRIKVGKQKCMLIRSHVHGPIKNFNIGTLRCTTLGHDQYLSSSNTNITLESLVVPVGCV